MTNDFPIRIPQEYVNDDTVKLLKWFVEEGQEVREGNAIAEVETSKAVVELAAGATGKIFQRTKVGDEVRVGDIIGYISTNGTSPGPAAPIFGSYDTPPAALVTNLPTGVRFSKKALELMQANGISASVFAQHSLVREQDVREHIERIRQQQSAAQSPHFALEGIPLDRITFPAAWKNDHLGKLDSDFLSRLRKAPEEFGRLSSAEKCEAYRKHGAVVGEGVVLFPGSVAIAPNIAIGARVQIGEGSSIHCRDRFAVGPLTSFRNVWVRGGTVVIGENIFGGSKVQIGGGGNGDPYSLLCIGDGTYLGDDVFINICRPVLIGKEVFLTQRSILVTHNIGHSILEGYENRFAPVVLEDYSQVGMNSTIYAGSRIGRGSIVMSNSYVVSSIPPGKLAGGIPARVLREATRPLDRKRQLEIVKEMIREYRELLMRKGHAVSELSTNPPLGFQVQCNGRCFSLRFTEKPAQDPADEPFADELIVWTFGNHDGSPASCTQMNLLSKTITGRNDGLFVEATREFLRKRGIRLEPGPWRYAGGLI